MTSECRGPDRCWIAGICFLLLTAAAATAGEHTLVLDGKETAVRHLSLNGTPDRLAPGDLVEVCDVWIRLAGDRLPELRSVDRRRYVLYRSVQDDRPVAIHVSSDVRSDPLGELLSPEEIRGLRGLSLRSWPEGFEDSLAHLDPRACAVYLFNTVAVGKGKALPALPRDLECLVLDTGVSDGFADFGRLRDMGELRALVVDSVMLDPPCSVLAGLTKLRALRAGVEEFDPGAIEGLREIRSLDLSWSDGVEDLGFVAALSHVKVLRLAGTAVRELAPLARTPSLEELDVGHTRVESLAPLSEAESLRRVRAHCSDLSILPDRELPNLELVDAVGALLPPPEAARFRERNPGCRLDFRWLDPLRHAVAGTTRLRVRPEGTCSVTHPKTLYETEDAEEIRALLDGLETVDRRPADGWSGRCSCCGHPTLEFWQGDRLLEAVSIHHGGSLRWRNWSPDAMLTDAGRRFLRQWLTERGIGEPDGD
jgi:hypothetical protein